MQSNTKVYLYVLQLTGVIAIILALLFNSLNPMFKKNKEVAKKKAILSCVPGQKSDLDIESVFNDRVKIILLDAEGNIVFEQKGDAAGLNEESKDIVAKMNERGQGVKYESAASVDLSSEEKFDVENRYYPVYRYEAEAGKFYHVVAVRGNGLWDKIWGFVALEPAEGNWLVAGVNFDHKGETPGLGAEIKDSQNFKDAFKGKKLFDGDKFVSVDVVKTVKQKDYQVQTISGATVTSDGVAEMLDRGIEYYLPYLSQVKG
jgi:Na+-transporting NADH:ubiquinone oxidoreductase subunit C